MDKEAKLEILRVKEWLIKHYSRSANKTILKGLHLNAQNILGDI